jgi:hypothetical protein
MSREKNEGLSKVAWGENGKRWKRTFFLLPLATKLWIYVHLPSPSLYKADSDDWGFSLSPGIIFNSILRILVPISFLKRKRMISLGNWEKEGE